MTLLLGSGKAGRKEDEREELDFQFDEEIVTPKHNRSEISISFRGILVTMINNDINNNRFSRILVTCFQLLITQYSGLMCYVINRVMVLIVSPL